MQRTVTSSTTEESKEQQTEVCNNGDFQVWFENFQIKLSKSLNDQIDKFLIDESAEIPQENLALMQSMRKAFRVNCDFYDPESDEFLRCQYLF